MDSMLNKYARLLVSYCLSIQPGEKLFIRSTTLAEPLVREVYREALRAGAVVESELEFEGQHRILLQEGNDTQLAYVSMLYSEAMQHFDAYLYIKAPFSLRDDYKPEPGRMRQRQQALSPFSNIYFERTATRALKRCLCQYPTQAQAQEAGMSLEAYEQFVFEACRLYEDDPVEAWRQLSKEQQHIVDYLNRCQDFRYLNDRTDIRFSTAGRIWINSDGQTNMPSGEVYTSPIEDSAQGFIHFDLPAIHQGQEVQHVSLWLKDGYVERWDAAQGKEVLDEVFGLPGARRLGEVAIGTNYRIQRFSRNILFDEKIGGTVHMAIGQSYLQTGGKNESAIHWDMIADMKQGGQIFADGVKIYENGLFLI